MPRPRANAILPPLLLALTLAAAPLAPAAAQALDGAEAWVSYREGLALYGEKRFGEALVSFQAAVARRRELATWAGARIDAALATPEARRSKDSLLAFMGFLEDRDLIARDAAAVRAAAGGSLRRRAELLRGKRLSDGFAGFLDALLAVLEQVPAAEFGDSLQALRASCARMGSYPEAEDRIGRIYLQEGELRLAELQFLRAYDMRDSLEVPGESWEILRALAGIYRVQERWRDYEDKLAEVVASSPFWSAGEAFLRNAMERTLVTEGFDRFMVLYRTEAGPSFEAALELGEFQLGNGRPQALIHLAAAANSLVTRAIARVAESEPGYVYVTLGELLGRVAADRELGAFARDKGLYRALVLLGEACARAGGRETARMIWREVAAREAAGAWRTRALTRLSEAPGASP